MNLNFTKQWVVIVPVGVADRRNVESIDNMPCDFVGDHTDWAAEQLGISREDMFWVYDVREFCEAVNDQMFDDLTDCYMGTFVQEVG